MDKYAFVKIKLGLSGAKLHKLASRLTKIINIFRELCIFIYITDYPSDSTLNEQISFHRRSTLDSESTDLELHCH